jgi:hypothetical protein
MASDMVTNALFCALCGRRTFAEETVWLRIGGAVMSTHVCREHRDQFRQATQMFAAVAQSVPNAQRQHHCHRRRQRDSN